jgi:hypothetical protein
MRQNFASGSIAFRKAYLQSLISVIEVDDDLSRTAEGKCGLESVKKTHQVAGVGGPGVPPDFSTSTGADINQT